MIRIHYVPPSPTTPLVEPPGFEHGTTTPDQAQWSGERTAFPQGARSRLELDFVGGRGRQRRNEKDVLQLSKEWQELAGQAGKQEGMFKLLHDATCSLDGAGKPNVHALRQARKRLRQWFYQQMTSDERNRPALKEQVATLDAALGRMMRRNLPPGEELEDDGPRVAKVLGRPASLGDKLLGWVLPTARDARALHREALKSWVAGDTDQALDAMEAAADKAPQDWRIQRDLGRMLADEGYWNEAEWALLSASQLRPRDAELHMALGELYAHQGLHAMAIESFRAAIVRQPSLTDAHAQLGVALYDDGRATEAAPHLQKAVSLDQQCVVARFYLAQVMLQQNDVLRARFQLGLVAQMSPEMDLERFGTQEPASLAAVAMRKEGTVYHWKLPGKPRTP